MSGVISGVLLHNIVLIQSYTRDTDAGVIYSLKMSCIISAAQPTEPTESQAVEPEVKPAEGSSWCVCVMCVCLQLAQSPSLTPHLFIFPNRFSHMETHHFTCLHACIL